MVDMDVDIEDHTIEVKKQFGLAVKTILKSLGEKAEGYAKDECPVETGRLRNSITYATEEYSGQGSYQDDEGNTYNDATVKGTVEKNVVVIGTNVEYAKAVELSDSARHKVGGAHFLANAIRNHTDEYEATVEAGLKD